MSVLVLFVIQVISALGRPVPHALVVCDGVVVCNDEGCELSALVGDSAGKVIIEGPVGDYACTGYMPDGSHPTLYIFQVDKAHARQTLRLQP